MADRWCSEHETVFFKKGNMRGFAHPILDENGEPTGKWCNEPKQEEVKPPPPKSEPPMSKENWAEKDKITRTSIERQKSLELATHWAIALLNSSSFTKKESLSSKSIRQTAQSFAEWIETGKIPEVVLAKESEGKQEQPPKSRLVEEAKKLGGKEIEKGD